MNFFLFRPTNFSRLIYKNWRKEFQITIFFSSIFRLSTDRTPLETKHPEPTCPPPPINTSLSQPKKKKQNTYWNDLWQRCFISLNAIVGIFGGLLGTRLDEIDKLWNAEWIFWCILVGYVNGTERAEGVARKAVWFWTPVRDDSQFWTPVRDDSQFWSPRRVALARTNSIEQSKRSRRKRRNPIEQSSPTHSV